MADREAAAPPEVVAGGDEVGEAVDELDAVVDAADALDCRAFV